ncbi:hypothetical protein PVAND_013873 [Polypedilum vanderplanki]|uniref:Zinc finger protein n=1 Tax=Polypedilum vanderplanki TaxID=319348 RepID=A0A9J6CS20_POLVA|nr:hypothetical protein PVAND_013873 [Polypedilum vanderplanki]
MGSEQYCLRWNNHQSNLLGVFSQLLQDESLVDVTLACSEGTSIRAHKVVLSACSSYFQSLFLDHPARHPIVILKDVRFSELRTLIEFMYKGEVNVEYCQLSALLKTAESLKVKGLAEMTNQNAVSKEPERDSDRLRLHTPTTPSAAPSSSVKNEMLEMSREKQRHDNEICTPSPPSRVPSSPGSSLSMYQKKLHTTSASASATTTSITGSGSHHIDSIIKEEPTFNDHRTHHQHRNDESMEDDDDDDDDENLHMKNEVGLNMTLNSTLLQNSISSSVNSTTSLADMQSSRYSSNLLGNSSSSGTRQSPLNSDLPGPSGIMGSAGPMQHAPLSLKKESDWDRSDDKESTSSDYRHSHGDMESSTDLLHGERSSSVVGLPISSSSSSEQNSSVNSNNSGPIYPCMYCGQTFPHQSKLTRHILSHSLETLKYREVSHLLGHTQFGLLSPHDLPPPSHFASRQVSMDSLEPSGDNSPMDMESNNPFANNPGTSNSNNDAAGSGGVVLCKFCGKSFPDVSSLITHLPVHTGDRPFKCEFCGKAFKLRHHMKDHCRVHTGERPFRCQMCGKTFSRSTILKAHEKTHYPKYVRKFLSPSPVDSKDDAQQ